MKEWWGKNIDNVLLGTVVLYVISLGVVTVDTIFGPWLFPPKLDRQIAEQVNKLQSMNPAEQAEAVNDLILDKGDFAVPALIKLLKKDGVSEQAKVNAMNALGKITEQSIGNDSQAWITWYEQNKSQFP